MNGTLASDSLFDSHCHLNEANYDADRAEVVERAVAAGVEKVIDIGVALDSSARAIANAKAFPGQVYAAVGIDMEHLIPGSDLYDSNFTQSKFEVAMAELRELVYANREFVAMIGETGMDGYYVRMKVEEGDLGVKEGQEIMRLQEALFRMHIELAVELGLPMSLHTRAVEKQCLQIVKDYQFANGIFHSFAGSYEMGKAIVDAGWGLGINGIATFKKSEDLRAVYRRLLGKVSSDWSPQDFYDRGVYFETDGPYLSPEGKRGQRNEPANVRDIYLAITTALS